MTEAEEKNHPFVLVAELASQLGVRNIKDLPACWEHRIDEHWFVAINAHLEPKKTVGGTGGVAVEPGYLYIEYNGWPAGLIHISGPGTIAAGDGANQKTFADAVRAVMATAGGRPK